MKKILLIEGSVTEIKSEEFFGMRERVGELEALLRESLNVSGDRAWHAKVYEALGEKPPPVRRLKGKIPRYQRGLIEAGKLDG